MQNEYTSPGTVYRLRGHLEIQLIENHDQAKTLFSEKLPHSILKKPNGKRLFFL